MKQTEMTQMLNSLSNQKIEFVTSRPEAASLPTAGRQVTVTGPPEAVALARMGDPQVLPALVNLLRDPQRAWAAEVLLASLTHREEGIVNAFANHPEAWQHGAGQNAYASWSAWLAAHQANLRWDSKTNAFVEHSQ
jgi:hypothetical protein